MQEIVSEYFGILLNQFKYDIANMSQPWMYWYVFPIIGYCVFFCMKWMMLTLPLWVPFTVTASMFSKINEREESTTK